VNDEHIPAQVRADRSDYLERHPSPEITDFRCTRCKAAPGTPCVSRGKAIPTGHAARVDQYVDARWMRQADAANYADNCENERAGDRYRFKVDRHLRYMKRVKARIHENSSRVR
jgi:hypothetical protein